MFLCAAFFLVVGDTKSASGLTFKPECISFLQLLFFFTHAFDYRYDYILGKSKSRFLLEYRIIRGMQMKFTRVTDTFGRKMKDKSGAAVAPETDEDHVVVENDYGDGDEDAGDDDYDDDDQAVKDAKAVDVNLSTEDLMKKYGPSANDSRAATFSLAMKYERVKHWHEELNAEGKNFRMVSTFLHA